MPRGPTPFASCMSSVMRSTSRSRSSSKALHLTRLHPEHRVAVLADPREREEPPRLALELLIVLGVVVLVLVSP